MKERKNIISMRGSALTLLGEPATIGNLAPDFTAIDPSGHEINFSYYNGKIVVITVFPSIDTPVCSAQARKFNKIATELNDNVIVITISKDLPFALNRYCAAEGIDNIITLSDYRHSEFGLKYGYLIKENMLLARGTIIVSKEGRIVYAEYVDDITKEPDYEAAIKTIEKL